MPILIYLMAIWHIFGHLGIFSPGLVCCAKKKSGNPVRYPALVTF
jgi:hypothetical protein